MTPLQRFPGPKPSPIVGNIFNFFTTDLKGLNFNFFLSVQKFILIQYTIALDDSS